MTLQTSLPDPQAIRQQQQRNMHRLMEKIERQRKAAESRVQQQNKLQTPTMKTPKKLAVIVMVILIVDHRLIGP